MRVWNIYKINLYLHYVENDQLYNNYPNFKVDAVRIRVVYDSTLTKDAEVFLNNLGFALNNINVLFDYFSTNEIEQINFFWLDVIGFQIVIKINQLIEKNSNNNEIYNISNKTFNNSFFGNVAFVCYGVHTIW